MSSSGTEKKDAAYKICGPIQHPVSDALKIVDIAKVRRSTTIGPRNENPGFDRLMLKGEISTGSFWLEKIDTFIPGLLKDRNLPQEEKIIERIHDQAWVERFHEGDSYFFYLGGSGQTKDFSIQLIPKEVQARTAISYKMGTLETSFTLARPFMIRTSTKSTMFSEKSIQEIVYLDAKYGHQQEQELNYVKNSFMNSMTQGINGKRCIDYRDGDGDDEDEFNKGAPYKQLKN